MENNALSLKFAIETREHLERQAKEGWEAFAAQLEAKIPTSVHTLAGERGWIKSDIDGFWKLPEFLSYLVSNTRSGGCNSEKYRINNLSDYGLKDFDDLKAEFKELEEAWAGIIRIEVDFESSGGEIYRAEVCYYATEFEIDT